MASGATHAEGLQDRPVELLRQLLRFDTTNPPGGERECIEWIRGLLEGLGCEVKILARDPQRPSLIARAAGRGESPPLLLQGHVDVVAARGDWRHPPFAGELADGYVWGRGALDMKGGVAMLLAAFMRVLASGAQPPGDVILCLMADEEAGSTLGADFLVREHAELFDGVRYSIGEFGGFTIDVAGRRFYPIMVAEKQVCWTRATLRGPSGHGSMPIRGGAMGRLGRLLARLDRRRLPVHVTPVARSMVETIAAELPATLALPLRGLLQPALTDRLLDTLGERVRLFDAMLHNTVSATIVGGGEKVNVIPDTIELSLDARLLPGQTPDDLFAELRALSGVELELEIVQHDPVAGEPDMALFETLAGTLREFDRSAKAVPLLLPGVTDGRFFSRLGIQTYGFLPMQLPPELPFMQLIHAADERLPIDAVEFGTNAIERVLERF
ncbi:MAG TPA: M20/M25/M40 family metallo-hydrolase [Solirubrobacteraceae bacterium]|jgi:acetylornithine deacetylase/succinyl-diaminopimelate desuccinylase-like protein|nr:M20/M25/M40 family metallo-hydrolase [Solirubrobacteraceae bacterium]